MKIYTVVVTVDYEGATAIAAFKDKDKAIKSLRDNVESQFQYGYEILDEGGDDSPLFKYVKMDADDEDSPTLVYSLTEIDLI